MHRILFRIPMPFGLKPLPIAAYGTMVALGALIGIYIAAVRAKRHGVNPNVILDLALAVLISGLIGARLAFFIFDDWSEFIGHGFVGALRQFINFPSGGLSFYGALALGVPVGIVFLTLRLRKEPGTRLWHVADIAIISIALGISFARVGCYLNGCCFGKPCPESFPLAQAYPLHQGERFSIPAEHYLDEYKDRIKQQAGWYAPDEIPPGFQWPILIYPTQIISSLNALVLFLVLSLLYRHRRFDGQLFCIFGIWYGIARALIEFLRADNKPTVGIFTTWQVAGFLLAPACIVLWIVLQRRHRRLAAASS